MKIAVASENGQVSPHFGHCPEFTIFDVEDGRVRDKAVVPNPGHQPGFLPRFLGEKGVACIIAGGMGPSAEELFAQQNIKTVIGAAGSVDDVIEAYLGGTLELGRSACDH